MCSASISCCTSWASEWQLRKSPTNSWYVAILPFSNLKIVIMRQNTRGFQKVLSLAILCYILGWKSAAGLIYWLASVLWKLYVVCLFDLWDAVYWSELVASTACLILTKSAVVRWSDFYPGQRSAAADTQCLWWKCARVKRWAAEFHWSRTSLEDDHLKNCHAVENSVMQTVESLCTR